VRLLKQSLGHRQNLPPGTAWVNYLRCHDDVGWAFANDDAAAAGIRPGDHRDFLNRFYTGRFEGSFAAGVPFQHNEDTGDMRICGTAASLAGLEQALQKRDDGLAEMALKRLRMLYGVLSSVGGIPLIFLGEEWAVLNDYTYLDQPEKADDSRWIHRPKADWALFENEVVREGTLRHRHYEGLRELFASANGSPRCRARRCGCCRARTAMCWVICARTAATGWRCWRTFRSTTRSWICAAGGRRPGALLQGRLHRPDGFHGRHRGAGLLRAALAGGGLEHFHPFCSRAVYCLGPGRRQAVAK
jgi:hypothetical protein